MTTTNRTRSRSQYRERDAHGRFTDRGRSYDEEYDRDYDHDYAYESEYDNDYDRDERGRGWYGDPEAHSEAAERGWSHPRHGESGWYGDPEGHSEASERGWAHTRHGESGWYGDPEGHSEAARRGWGHRNDSHSSNRGHGGNARRGFAAMDREEVRRIARMGGKASHSGRNRGRY